jgi:hypothetical protein
VKLIDLGIVALILAAWIIIACIFGLAIGRAFRQPARPEHDTLMALADATRERKPVPAGPCGCKWYDDDGEPVYSPCPQHDYSLVAAHFEQWEHEYNRQNGIEA